MSDTPSVPPLPPTPPTVTEHAQPHAAQVKYVAQMLDGMVIIDELKPPDVAKLYAKELRDAAAYIERIEKENTALRKPMQKHCASCVDAQCWGVRVAAEARAEQAEAEAAALREERDRLKAQLRSDAVE